MRHQVSLGTVNWLCLWGEIGALSIFRARLFRIVRSPPLRRAIYKIDRVQQPNGRLRFDLYIGAAATDQVRQLLTTSPRASGYGWYIRSHVHYRDRVPATAGRGPTVATAAPTGVPPANAPGSRSGGLRVCSYNINGIARKRTELAYFLQNTHCDVVGLQETLLRSTDWHLRIPQFTCFTAMGDLTASTRGVALAVSRKFACSPIGSASPYWVFARLYGASLTRPTIVGTVYVPCRTGRNHVLSRLPLAIAELRAQYPNDPLILTGDWNADLDEVQREVATWTHPVHTLANYGHRPTRRRGNRVVDHISYWGSPADLDSAPPTPRVLEEWDYSDHYPVMARFPRLTTRGPEPPAQPPAASLPRIRVKNPESKADIRQSNRWSVLAEEFQNTLDESGEDEIRERLEQCSKKWIEVCHEVARETDVVDTYSGPKPGTFSNSTVRALRRRRRKFKALQQAIRSDDDAMLDSVRFAHRKAVEDARRTLRRERAKSWYKRIYRAHIEMLHRPREFWQFSSRHGRWRTKGAPAGLQPIYDTNGALLTETPAIVARWAEHFQALATDVTGQGQDEEYWSTLFDTDVARRPELPGLNCDITRGDVWEALSRMKRHRAPGRDGIPTDFLQAALEERKLIESVDEGPEPPSPMSTCLVTLCNLALDCGGIPETWEESVVVALPKKGDLADCSNYRGISLMSTTLKLLLVILTERINSQSEIAKLFSPAQAGFRSLEEAVTQAACVYDILERRHLCHRPTFATFIDLKKAYDVVPHGALFAKLSAWGVRGRILTFLKGLYRRSTITVRIGHGNTAQFSEPFQLQRGLRQGCPLSPILFNIFINDYFDDLLGQAVEVPTKQRGSPPISCPGALFADDIVALAETIEDTIKICDHTTAWCAVNQMSVGISKCAILEFHAPGDDYTLTDEHPSRARLVIGGEPVPIANKYQYLGLTFTTPVPKAPILVQSRFLLGQRTVGSLMPFFRSRVLPLAMKRTVFQAVAMTRFLYGAEIYGMNRRLTDRMQVLANRALRGMLGVSRGAIVPSAPLWHSFHILPICAYAAGRRARAYRKCFQLSTHVGQLIRHQLRDLRWTWSSGCKKWINRFGKPHFPTRLASKALDIDPNGWEDLNSAELKEVVELAIVRRERRLRENPTPSATVRTTQRATKLYYNSGYTDLRSLSKARVLSQPSDSPGVTLVLRCRLGVYLLAPRLVALARIQPQYDTRCPFCERHQAETLYHLFFECTAWRRQRETTGLQETLDQVVDLLTADRTAPRDVEAFESSQMTRLTEEELAVAWLLGGSCGHRWEIPNYFPPRPVRENLDQATAVVSTPVANEDDPSSSSASVESGRSLGTSTQSTPALQDGPHLFRVGNFLSRIRLPRKRVLSKPSVRLLHAPPGYGVGGGPLALATATGPGPNG